MHSQKPVIFIDGVCNLCHGLILFLIKRDKKNIFKFSQLQSPYASRVLPPELLQLQTVVFQKEGQFFTQSKAIIEILSLLPGLWKLIKIFHVFPDFILNSLYAWIAKNRYNWFGKQNACWIPTPELQKRFIQD